jgi:hypothetical protein
MRHPLKLFTLLAAIFTTTIGTAAFTGITRNANPATLQQPTVSSPTAQSGSYRVTVDSVHRKANNFTITLVFENLSDNTLRLEWSGGPNNERWGPYLFDENSPKYFLQEIDSDRVVGHGSDLLARTKLKSRFLFYGPAQGSIFSLVAAREPTT